MMIGLTKYSLAQTLLLECHHSRKEDMLMKKEQYETLEMETVVFDTEDVIRTSGEDIVDGDED